jgi:hypothetical protein
MLHGEIQTCLGNSHALDIAFKIIHFTQVIVHAINCQIESAPFALVPPANFKNVLYQKASDFIVKTFGIFEIMFIYFVLWLLLLEVENDILLVLLSLILLLEMVFKARKDLFRFVWRNIILRDD